MTTHPIVSLILTEMREHGWTLRTLEDASGVSRGAFGRWERGGQPNLMNAEAVLNTLGFDLIVERRDGPVPKPPHQPYDALRRPRTKPATRKKAWTGPRKLTQEQVDDIRTRRMKGIAYAKLYGVTQALVSLIQRGKRWPPRASPPQQQEDGRDERRSFTLPGLR